MLQNAISQKRLWTFKTEMDCQGKVVQGLHCTKLLN